MNFFETFLECSLSSTVSKKYNKKRQVTVLAKEILWANVTPFMPVLVLITCIIHCAMLHFVVAGSRVYLSNTWKKTCWAYRTMSYKICGINHTIKKDVEVKYFLSCCFPATGISFFLSNNFFLNFSN